MANRNRTNPVQFYLSDDEQYILNTKFKASGMKSMSACLAARHPWRIPRDLQAWIGLERARRSYVANGCPCRTRRLVG